MMASDCLDLGSHKCTIGQTFRAVKKEVRRKKKLKLEGKGRKYSSRLLFSYDHCNSKSSF